MPYGASPSQTPILPTSPEAFQYKTKLGAKAESAVMVGDSWERDIIGALDAGLSAVWVSADTWVSAQAMRI